MKRYLTALVALMVMMFAGNAMAFTPPPPPPSGWYVVDQANVLTPGQVDEINHRILAVSKVTKNEFGVLILQTMDGANIDDVANATYRAWGVGKRGLDNGILLAISVGDRKWRIEVGKGVEGDVTDLQAADVGRNHLVPHLKQRPMDWYGGILETINTLDGLMESRINARVPVAAGVPRPLQYANTAPAVNAPTTVRAAPPPVVVASPPPVNVPVPVLAAPVVAAAPTVSDPQAQSSSDGVGVFLFVGLVVLLVLGGIFLYSSHRSSKEEEERQRELQAIEAQNRRARAVQEAAERVAREQEATRLRNQEALNRQATATVVPAPTRHTVHHVDRQMTEQYVAKPSRPLDVPARPRPVVVQTPPRDTSMEDAAAAAIAAAALAAAARRREDDLEEARLRQAREDERRRERDEEERQRRARDEEDERRRRREREEEDDRRRRDEESSRRSNDWSSPSSNDSGGGWGGGDSGGGGFGGGDSGGGGASGDF